MPKRKIVDQPTPLEVADDGSTRRSKRRTSAGPVDIPTKRAHATRHEQETIVEESVVTDVTTLNADRHVHFPESEPDMVASTSVTTTTQEVHQTILAPASETTLPASPRLSTKGASRQAVRVSSSPTSDRQAKLLKDESDTRFKRRSRRNQSIDELNDAIAESEDELIGAMEEGDDDAVFPGYPNLETSNPVTTADDDDDNVMVVGAVEPINHVALLEGDHEATIKGLEHQIVNLEAKVQHWLIAYQSWLLKLEPYALPPSPTNAEEKMDHAVDGVLSHLAKTEHRATNAEAALSALSEDITSLGFEGEGVEDVLSSITEQFRETRLALEYLVPGETVHGFNNSKLLQGLMDRIRALVQQVKEAETTTKKQRHDQAALREQFNITLETLGSTCEQVKELKSQLENQTSLVSSGRTKITKIEAELTEKERSISKLQQALEGYRTEVANLEKLVTQLETGHKTTVAQLQQEKSETVTDLESKVTAETKGRRAAEAAAVESNELVAELEERLHEARKHTEDTRAELEALLIVKETEVAVEIQGRQATEAALVGKNHAIADLERMLEAAVMNTEEVRAGLGSRLVDIERALVEEKKGHRAALATVEKLTKLVDQLQGQINATEEEIEEAMAELREQLAEKEAEVTQETGARHAAESGLNEKTKTITALEKKLATAQKHARDIKADTQAQLANKENEIVSLQSTAFEKEQQHGATLASKDQEIDALRLEISNLTSTLAGANDSVSTLQYTNTSLEARLTEEIDHGIKAVELMQAEMMRSLARVSDVKNTYVHHAKESRIATVAVNGQVVSRTAGAGAGASASAGKEVDVHRSLGRAAAGMEVGTGASMQMPSTPAGRNTVRFTDVEVTSSGKRQRVSRMNGDSGVGALDEVE